MEIKTENIPKQTIQPWDPHILSYRWWKHKIQIAPKLSNNFITYINHNLSLVTSFFTIFLVADVIYCDCHMIKVVLIFFFFLET